MSEEQLKAFIAKAKDDQSIQDKLKAAKTTEDVVSIAKEFGHEFNGDKFTELSAEELVVIAGWGGNLRWTREILLPLIALIASDSEITWRRGCGRKGVTSVLLNRYEY